MNIIIRIFPRDRISDIKIENLVIATDNGKTPIGSDVFKATETISPDKFKLARGTRFIREDSHLVEGETLNAFPIA
jgi:hypothetical protein